MKKTIFISSTFRDLIPHRNQIWKVLTDFDVNIKGMEEFGARKSAPLQTCIDEIESSDIYIGVISMCYGSIDELTQKSFTQLEYEKAKEKGIEILIYLIDESNGEVRTSHIDFGENYYNLLNFKKILKRNHTVDFFINEIDLGQKVFKKLEKLLSTPEENTIRPRYIEAKVHRTLFSDEAWIILVGYNKGKPFELFSCLTDDPDGILLPRSVMNGIIAFNNDDGIPRFDFQYENKRGYKTTIEGINYVFNQRIATYGKIVNSLLRNNVQLSVVISTLKNMFSNDKFLDSWIEKVISILDD